MKKLSLATKVLLVGLAAIVVSLILGSGDLLWGGSEVVFISLILYAKSFVNKILAKSGRSYYPSFWLIIVIGYIIFLASGVVIIGFIVDWDLTAAGVIGIILFNLLFSILYTYLYFLPYLIANKRNHIQTRAIYILNIFAGWTIIAWIIALIWAHTESKQSTVIQQTGTISNADELIKYKNLLDQGVITQDEFDAKKKQILDV